MCSVHSLKEFCFWTRIGQVLIGCDFYLKCLVLVVELWLISGVMFHWKIHWESCLWILKEKLRNVFFKLKTTKSSLLTRITRFNNIQFSNLTEVPSFIICVIDWTWKKHLLLEISRRKNAFLSLIFNIFISRFDLVCFIKAK